MLARDGIIPFLLNRCPEFGPTWEEHQRGITANVGAYIDVAEFVQFIMECYEKEHREILSRAFGAVEEMLVDGDSEVQEIAALGILETLQCSASWEPYGNKAFIPWLGPKSLVEWDELVEVWRGKSSLAEVIRAENKPRSGSDR